MSSKTMPRAAKPKIGRPMLPKGEAKGRVVPIRFNAADLKRVELAARSRQKTVSAGIRGAVASAMGRRLGHGGNQKQIRTLPRRWGGTRATIQPLVVLTLPPATETTRAVPD